MMAQPKINCTCKDSSLLFVFVMCQKLCSAEELQSVSDVVREYTLCCLTIWRLTTTMWVVPHS